VEDEIIASALGTSPVGLYWDVVEASGFTDRNTRVKLGVPYKSFQIVERVGTLVAHYHYLVRPGIMHAARLFRGVQRPMKCEDDMAADQKVLIYMWRPDANYEWVGGRHSSAFPARYPPPANEVFVALVRPFLEPDSDGISGALLKWNWIDGDLTSFDWKRRYNEEIWS
jgi:hypothetical protein